MASSASATKPRTILDVLDDPKWFGQLLSDPSTWRAWRVVLAAIFALPIARRDMPLFRQLTGRTRAPRSRAEEAWLVVGRRGGKSRIMALVAAFLALFVDWRSYLAFGERGTIPCIAQDRKQARVVFRYLQAIMRLLPRGRIKRMTSDEIDLANGITIEIHSASFRSTRGYTIVAALCDEIAYWRTDDSANPDREIIDAIRPAMATVPGALLLGVSSPYRRAGVLWEAYRDHFGRDDDPILVVRADTRTMNPTVRQSVIDRAYARDPARAAAEYGAEFRTDVGAFLDPDWIDAAARPEATDLPPLPGLRYAAFADPSGGRGDAFALAIAHAEGRRRVVDAVRARRPPFNPQAIVAEFADVLKRYGLRDVTGDRYAGEWVASAFRQHGITYRPAAKAKSEIYLEAGPLFAEGAASLPGSSALLAELRQLERRTHRSGRDTVDHPPGGHDDLANAACGALWRCRQQGRAVYRIDGDMPPDAIQPVMFQGLSYTGGDFGAWARGA